MTYRLEITRRAKQDRDACFDYIHVIYVIHVRGAGQDVMAADEIELPDPQ